MFRGARTVMVILLKFHQDLDVKAGPYLREGGRVQPPNAEKKIFWQRKKARPAKCER